MVIKEVILTVLRSKPDAWHMISISRCNCQAHDDIHKALDDAEVVRNHYAISKSWKGAASVSNPARKIDYLSFICDTN